MKHKILLRPERLRRIPRQFSWVDQRLLLEGRLRGQAAQAWALYLLLVLAGDARGLSYYSDPKAAELLGMAAPELVQARRELIAAGLIAYQSPFYQVLGLDEPAAAEPRSGETRSAGEILGALLARAAALRQDDAGTAGPQPRSP